jgi:deazaflavin-dependent oxidoreductase (nitroreductase family)
MLSAMAKQLGRLTASDRAGDALMKVLLRVGLAPRHMYLLTVPGRRTGTLYSTPVILVERADGRYLVAPYGERAWVKNARAAGAVQLSRGRRPERSSITALGPDQAAPILRDYLRVATAPRPYFDAGPDSPVEAFRAEADRHPVFRLASLPR